MLGTRRAGIFTALGVSTGQLVWTFAASIGIAALLVASEPAFQALKLVGAAYLILLGLQALWSVVRRRSPARASEPRRAVSPRQAWRQGVLSNLGNPKSAAFFTSLLPQFVDSFVILLALGLLYSALTLAWLSGYAVAVANALPEVKAVATPLPAPSSSRLGYASPASDPELHLCPNHTKVGV